MEQRIDPYFKPVQGEFDAVPAMAMLDQHNGLGAFNNLAACHEVLTSVTIPEPSTGEISASDPSTQPEPDSPAEPEGGKNDGFADPDWDPDYPDWYPKEWPKSVGLLATGQEVSLEQHDNFSWFKS